VIVLEVAGLPEAQKRFEVRMHRIISPFAGEYVYTGLFVPTMTPLIFQ